MTELTDDQVKALAHRYRFAKDDHERTIAQTARALLDARAERDQARAEHAASLIRINAEAVEAVAQARADAQAAVADIVRSVWGRCEALEDEAADKLAQLEKLTDHEKGFWRGQKTVAKSIRRSTEMPTAEAIAIRRAEGGKA